jgi:hypothetical protein
MYNLPIPGTTIDTSSVPREINGDEKLAIWSKVLKEKAKTMNLAQI